MTALRKMRGGCSLSLSAMDTSQLELVDYAKYLLILIFLIHYE